MNNFDTLTDSKPQGGFGPTPPRSLAETGLPPVMLRDILLKTIFRMSLDQISDIARAICLPVPVTQEIIDIARSQQLLEATGTLGATSRSEMGYRLSDSGKARALDALAQSEYYGAVPVPMPHYARQVERQSVRDIRITRTELTAAMGDLILPHSLLDHLGPAVTSGRSILLYGPPGNGKSSISNGIRDALGDRIYIPRAVEHAGQVISVYDPIIHTKADTTEDDPTSLRRNANRHDPRYVRCDRPAVITGGELTLSMLDLTYNPTARTYQAPLQFKATGGVFIVDDLGRQEETPQALINRWIVPLEEGHDILALQSGEKFTVPFDTLVIFSTNFHPNRIFDRAALRRIFFKIKVDGPDQQDFLKIFALVARKKGMALDERTLVHLMQVRFPEIGNAYANYMPGFLIDQMLSVCEFEGLPRQMTPELIDRAWDNMFVRDEDIER
ncbi:ATPase [Alkalilacustris brevis]|uniref:ATPase n=1 Tax=Alkalilacustris brevis TaxID=2026338 RepID=UPI000E0CE56A|nr:ATPase [Alkalilacustris brevis]